MPESFVFPTSSEMEEIEQDLLPQLEEGRLGLELLPVENKDHHRLVWEQRDNYKGLQQVRGLNGQPQNVRPIGANQFEMKPGIYGEFMDIDEEEITLRRAYGDLNKPIDITDLVSERQEQLLVRRLNRIEKVVWDLLTAGTFTVMAPQGGIMHQDQFPIKQFTSVIPWTTFGTSKPLADFRTARLFGRGQSAVFDASATAWMNQKTLDTMLANTNTNDIAGRRTSGLNTVLSQDEMNKVLLGETLPQLGVYDRGYIGEDDVWTPWIPDGKIVIVGKRPSGVPLGKYRMTRNAQKPNAAPGAYTYFVDRTGQEVPATRRVHDGHNGGPVLFFPGGFLCMTVF